MTNELKALYVSPGAKTIDVKTQDILCQSEGSITDMIVDPDGGADFE